MQNYAKFTNLLFKTYPFLASSLFKKVFNKLICIFEKFFYERFFTDIRH